MAEWIEKGNWLIGISDQNEEGRWIWENSGNDASGFDRWAADGQPHGFNPKDDCAIMDSDNGYQWVAVK